jgi:thioesterase domain-containing protein/acyl carrier protein
MGVVPQTKTANRPPGIGAQEDALADLPPRGSRLGSGDACFDLTAPQLAIWLDQALHPGKPIYNTGQVLTIFEDLDVEHFTAALRQVVQENDALRLRFTQAGGRIHQEIVPEVGVPLEQRDFFGESEPEPAALAWLEELFWQRLEPTDFPLFKFALARTGKACLWLQKYHHLVIDATGRLLVAARAAEIYSRRLTGADSPFLRGPSFRSAKIAEEQYLSSERAVADAEFWKTRFAALPDPLVTVSPRLTEKARSGRRARIDCRLSQEDSVALRDFARTHGSTPFKILLALVWSCFHRGHDRSDLVLGVPVAGRSTDAAKRTVGLFSRVIPFRPQLEATMPLAAALAKINDELTAHLEHQHYPADHLRRELKLRQSGREGLYDVVVNYVRNDYGFRFADAPVRCTNLSSGLFVPCSVMGLDFGKDEPIQVIFDYDRGRVPENEAAQFVDGLRKLLSRLRDSANCPIGELLRTEEAPRIDEAPHVPAQAPHPGSRSSLAPASSGNDRPPTDACEAALLELWRASFDGWDIRPSDNYFELGGDSLKALSLIAQCNDRFGAALPLATLFENPTVAQLASVIRAASADAPPSPLVKMRGGGDAAPLMLVHPAGGELYCYRDLVAGLSHERPIYGLRAPCIDSDGHLPATIEELADQYIRAAAATLGDSGWHLAGWSFGGLVAAAMAGRLARRPLSLTLIDTPARLAATDDEAAVLALIAAALGLEPERLAMVEVPLTAGAIVAAASTQLPRAAVSGAQIDRMATLVRDVRRLRAGHKPARIRGPLTLIRATSGATDFDKDFAWSPLADGPVHVTWVEGTHNSIVRSPSVDHVAATLTRAIAAGDAW